MSNTSKGTVFIVAAPSGGGKTSLVKELTTTLEDIEVSISHTTRPARPREVEGQDYFFVSQDKFKEMIAAKAFVEYACVFNHHYGTSQAEINKRLDQGIDVVLDIDWQGAQQIKKIFPDAKSIFIIPPSLNALRERLQCRGQDNEEVISCRMLAAQKELAHYADFDYLVVNDVFSKASLELQSIVIANRLLRERQSGKLGKLLSLLLASQ